jgi:hypothetical protein
MASWYSRDVWPTIAGPRYVGGRIGIDRDLRSYDRCMKVPWGARLPIPSAILDRVSSIARRLHRDVAGDDLFLLALAELPGGSPARRALESEGLDAERLRIEISADGDGSPNGQGGLTFPPAFYSMQGRAEGFAAVLGDGTITPEHVLVALLWDPMSISSQLLWRLGVSRERVVQRLQESGVSVPPTPMPAQREIDMGERVWFDREKVEAVLDHLSRKLPPGVHLGFNYAGNRAWVVAETSIDLEGLVDQVG